MADAMFNFGEPGIKALFKLETDIEYFERVAGPRAAVAAINKMRTTIKTRVSRAVWEEARAGKIVDSRGIPWGGYSGRPAVKLAHIRKRVYTSKATRNRKHVKVTGYINNMSLMSLTSTRKGVTAVRGRVHKKTRRKGSISGVTVGGVKLEGGFIQHVQNKQQVLVFKRKGKTWMPGQYGWNYPPGSNQKGARAPYDVVKLDLETPFKKNFHSTVFKVVKERGQLEYERALVAVGGRLMKNGKY